MKLKRQYKKERLQIFANNSVSKNTMRILLGLLIALATVGCPGSNSGGPQTGTFPYVCPDGTPTEGMIATEDTVSCSACNTGFDLTDTGCMMSAGNFPYICPNGTPTAGMVATENTISCETCTTTGFKLIATRCTKGCTGTAISTAAELMNIAATGDFHLTSDIDLTGVTWIPKAFNGCLNGLGFVISNLSLALPLMDSDDHALSEYGLFSTLEESAMIQNLGLEDVSITGTLLLSTVTGSIAATNAGTIRASYAHGQITAILPDKSTTGGLVGINTGTIQESYAHVSIGSDSAASGFSVGGIVGFNSGGTIENSFATGGASSFVRGLDRVGGLVGLHQIVSFGGSRPASIANSYSIAIRARALTRSGGLVGVSEGYSPLSLGASIADSYSATQPLGANFLGGLVADANSTRTSDANIRVTTFTGKNYYTTTNGVNGVGEGSCAAANCIQATGSTNAQRRTWLVDTLNETDLGWSADIWNNLGMTGWPCLKRINDAFSGQDGCPPMAPFICPGGTATVGDSVTGSISCSACTTAMGYKLVGSQCVRFEGDFSRIGTANQFGFSVLGPRGLASIGDTLYMVGGTLTNVALYTLDIASGSSTLGEATRVGTAVQFGVSESRPYDLASIGDTLYMVGGDNDALYTLNITSGSSTLGEATRVGAASQFGVGENFPRGLASVGGTLYMVGRNNDALYTLDTSTSIATQVGTAVQFGDAEEDLPSDLANIGNTLYMLRNDSVLYTLDITSGSSTLGEATRVGAASQFGVGENFPTGLASIGDTLYMVGETNNALYKAKVE